MDSEQLILPTHGARQRHTSWHGHGANQGRPGANPDVLWRLRDRDTRRGIDNDARRGMDNDTRRGMDMGLTRVGPRPTLTCCGDYAIAP